MNIGLKCKAKVEGSWKPRWNADARNRARCTRNVGPSGLETSALMPDRHEGCRRKRMKKNVLEESPICTDLDSCKFDSVISPAAARGSGHQTPDPEGSPEPAGSMAREGNLVTEPGVHRDPQTGRYAPPPAEQKRRAARLEVLRAEIREAVTAGRLPDSLVTLWHEELALVVDALRQLTRDLEPATATGRVSRNYKDYVLLVDRAATLARWLGLSAAEVSKQKPWSKLNRAEQEAEAQRALAEVEDNLRASNFDDDDEEQGHGA